VTVIGTTLVVVRNTVVCCGGPCADGVTAIRVTPTNTVAVSARDVRDRLDSRRVLVKLSLCAHGAP